MKISIKQLIALLVAVAAGSYAFAMQAAKLSEKNIFSLKGDVKIMGLTRVYNPSFVKEYFSDGGKESLVDCLYVLIFDENGRPISVQEYDGNDSNKLLGDYNINYSGNRVEVNGTVYENTPFKANYTREMDGNSISYSYVDGLGGAISEDAFIDSGGSSLYYEFDANGNLPNATFSRFAPPFVSYGNDIYIQSVTPKSGSGSLTISCEFPYGGDSYFIGDSDIQVTETDEMGNWTERVVSQNGRPVFMEVRRLSYYDPTEIQANAAAKKKEMTEKPFIGQWTYDKKEDMGGGEWIETNCTLVLNLYDKIIPDGGVQPSHGVIIAGYSTDSGIYKMTPYQISGAKVTGDKAEIEFFSENSYDIYTATVVYNPSNQTIIITDITFKEDGSLGEEEASMMNVSDISPAEGVYKFLKRSTSN